MSSRSILSSGLEIHQSMNVEKLDYENATWQLMMESGEVFSCQELVLTPPLPQVVNLLERFEPFKSNSR